MMTAQKSTHVYKLHVKLHGASPQVHPFVPGAIKLFNSALGGGGGIAGGRWRGNLQHCSTS